MLQARLNEGKGPAVYLCPNNYLIEQTCEQARQFGIATCQAEPDLPEAFLTSEQILVTSVQKLFNGLTKFGLERTAVAVGTLLSSTRYWTVKLSSPSSHPRMRVAAMAL